MMFAIWQVRECVVLRTGDNALVEDGNKMERVTNAKKTPHGSAISKS